MIEDLRVASPVHRSFELPLHFVLAEMLVENVVEEFIWNRMIRLRLENAFNTLQNSHMFERGFAKEHLSGENIGFGKSYSFRCNLNIALAERGKTKKCRGLNDGQEVIDIHS